MALIWYFLPPLKDRTEDIPQLLDYFSKKISELNGINETKLDTDFDLFYKYDWPGNVRELRNLVERILILSVNENSNNINQLVHEALTHKNIYKETESDKNVLSYPLKEAREKFGFLLDALDYGCPPHGGIALGFDRMMMFMLKTDSIRDVIAFPKTQTASCLLTSAPTSASTKQLQELGIKLSKPKYE